MDVFDETKTKELEAIQNEIREIRAQILKPQATTNLGFDPIQATKLRLSQLERAQRLVRKDDTSDLKLFARRLERIERHMGIIPLSTVPNAEPQPLTVEQWQDTATPRTELHHGFEYDLRARAVSVRHSAICANLSCALANAIGNNSSFQSYSVCAAGPLVRICDTEAYVPDLSVEYDRQPDTHPLHIKPGVVIEVVSPTTAAYDKGTKRTNYMQMQYMTDVLLVDDDEKTITIDSVNDSGSQWSQRVVSLGDLKQLHEVQLSCGLVIVLEDIFVS